MYSSNIIAGYKDLFPNGNKDYQSFVNRLPSNLIISVLIALNNELNTNETPHRIQSRLFNLLTSRFTYKQKIELDTAFRRYNQKVRGQYSGIIFGKRHLLTAIVKELNNYRECLDHVDSPIDEYNLLKAYLIAVDEVNTKDQTFIDFTKLERTDPLSKYKLLWPILLNQWEWNEQVNIIFETFRLFCFLKYVKVKYRDFLKEYLHSLGFESIEQLVASFNQINNATNIENEKEILKKLVYIVPKPNSTKKHLCRQAINQLIGSNEITISDIRKFPLYYNSNRGYMTIDRSTYLKKNYRGPFFELRANTSLKDIESFNVYSTNISKELEKTCLSPILTILSNSKADVLHFDDETSSSPDGYIRIGNTVFLFEYKAYFFPETLTNTPDFDSIKKYIDERFIKNEKDKEKGVLQLKSQIEILNSNGFHFDKDIKKNESPIKIYPIIIHQDFQFSLPGLNHYLNESLKDNLKKTQNNLEIQQLLFVNLEVLLDMAICEKDFSYLEYSLQEYWKFLEEYGLKFAKTARQDDFIRSHLSFDQFYNLKLIKKLDNPNSTTPHLQKLLDLAEISLNEFKEPI